MPNKTCTIRDCIIRNGMFSYQLEVDGKKIPFSGGYAAEYFKEHYTSLGYKVIEIEIEEKD